MARKRPEPVEVIKQRRDGALRAMIDSIPYAQFLGVEFERRGDEITAILPFQDRLIGNPLLPALHGGVTASFLEITAIVSLHWITLWEDIESGVIDTGQIQSGDLPRLPRTIDFTVDYLRSGLPRDAYARATVSRAGRRYASVHVQGWQDNRDRLYAQATGHFLMPRSEPKVDAKGD